MPFVSRSQFSLIASAGQPKSLVLQREGAVSFIQLFSTSTSVCQGGGKRRLNTLCNSTRPDAVLLRFNVPFFCLCRWKRLAGWGREWTKSRQSQGQGEMKRARETETTAPWPGLCHTTEVSSFKGMLHSEGGNDNNVVDIVFSRVVLGEYMRLSLFCPHVIPAIVATYLRKRSTGWSHSMCLASWAMNYVSSKMQSASTQVLRGSMCARVHVNTWICVCVFACLSGRLIEQAWETECVR